MEKESNLLELLAGISVYRQIKKDPIVKRLARLLGQMQTGEADFTVLVKQYSKFCGALYRCDYPGNFADYLTDRVLYDENVFTRLCAHEKLLGMPDVIRDAAKFDLNVLYHLMQVTAEQIKERLNQLYPEQAELIARLPGFLSKPEQFAHFAQWGDNCKEIAEFHYRNGVSIFAKYPAFYFSEEHEVVPAASFEPVHLDSLKKYALQKSQVVDNTLSFIHKKPANNVLLYGDRGTGKSTMVSAILTEYRTQGLRMIQISKEDILYISHLLKAIRTVPLRFIIFIDDLTFNENDECFNTLKAVLEGSLNSMPENVLIYATTNRRHLIKETFSAREGNELHASDTRDENASLADRFGLTVTFSKPNLPEFLEIVCEIAQERGLAIDEETLRRGANTFAMRKASRSGRVARQYVDYVEGRLSLNLPF